MKFYDYLLNEVFNKREPKWVESEDIKPDMYVYKFLTHQNELFTFRAYKDENNVWICSFTDSKGMMGNKGVGNSHSSVWSYLLFVLTRFLDKCSPDKFGFDGADDRLDKFYSTDRFKNKIIAVSGHKCNPKRYKNQYFIYEANIYIDGNCPVRQIAPTEEYVWLSQVTKIYENLYYGQGQYFIQKPDGEWRWFLQRKAHPDENEATWMLEHFKGRPVIKHEDCFEIL